jgi:hypothetical protein
MNKEEWKDLVRSICNHLIFSKLRGIWKQYHPFEFYEHHFFRDWEIFKISRTIRFIDDNFGEDDDLFAAFNKEFLDKTLNNLLLNIEDNNRVVMKTGLSEIIDEFYDEIVDGMEITDMPDADFEALSISGSQDPKGELLILMTRIKKRKEEIKYNLNKESITYSLKESENIVIKKKGVLNTCNSNNPPTKRKIFKGLGNICRGVILTGVDVGLLAGLWPLPISSDTTTIGATVSIITGVGDISIGTGELRGE